MFEDRQDGEDGIKNAEGQNEDESGDRLLYLGRLPFMKAAIRPNNRLKDIQ